MERRYGRWLLSVARMSTRYATFVVLGWLSVVATVNVAVPQLEQVISRDSTPIVPAEAPSIRAIAAMDRSFGNRGSKSFVFVVLERDGGLTNADRAYYGRLAAALREDHGHVAFVQDVRHEQRLTRALTSKDGDAMYLPVGLPGDTGAPAAKDQVAAVRSVAHQMSPAGLHVAVTGPAATIADMSTEIEHNLVKLTLVTVVLIAVILWIIYRSVAVMALVLGFIGTSLACARGFTALLGGWLFHVSTFTGAFLTAVVLGAATDYAIFMISRYQEERRRGREPRDAALITSSRVSGVITGSALTVVVANACMALARVGIFRTTGPAIAVGVAVTLCLSLTLFPALLHLAGRRGWLDPHPLRAGGARSPAGRVWERLSVVVVARPVRVLVAGLVPLVLLASFVPHLKVTYDERSIQPQRTESNVGYALLGAHFPLNEVLPDYVMVVADHDMRNAHDLAALEQTAAAIARTPGVVSVRGVTRPAGVPIPQASLGYQAGVVGERLDTASKRVQGGEAGAQRLAIGGRRVAAGAGRVARGAERALGGAARLMTGVRGLEHGFLALTRGTEAVSDGSSRLKSGAVALAGGLRSAYGLTGVAVSGLGLAYDALARSLTCGLDPVCSRARDGLRRVYEGERDELLPGLLNATLAAQRLARGTIELHRGIARLGSGLNRAGQGLARIQAGSLAWRTKMRALLNGAQRVGSGSLQIRQGSGHVAGSLSSLHAGLVGAASYLRRTSSGAKDPAIGGFYLPPAAIADPRFALASGAYLSSDGRTARMIVLGDTDSFGLVASRRASELRSAASLSLNGTSLSGSRITATGMATINSDLEDLSRADFLLVAGVALVAIFLILLALLRSIVAAFFLLASVVLSYAAALGLAVVVCQIGLGQHIDWGVPPISFILLVAVGADYNMLLMKRMQEEATDDSRQGVARALSATGHVITAAGVLFAASMLAMMAGTVATLTQMGFTVGMGLLLDTFVVRTLVVPAISACLGPWLWWPRRHPRGAHGIPVSR